MNQQNRGSTSTIYLVNKIKRIKNIKMPNLLDNKNKITRQSKEFETPINKT